MHGCVCVCVLLRAYLSRTANSFELLFFFAVARAFRLNYVTFLGIGWCSSRFSFSHRHTYLTRLVSGSLRSQIFPHRRVFDGELPMVRPGFFEHGLDRNKFPVHSTTEVSSTSGFFSFGKHNKGNAGQLISLNKWLMIN